MPKVSVVIPTYNVERWLPDFLDSLDAQTGGLSGFELVFVDDGSPDNSADLISAWISRSGVDAKLIRKPNGGLSSARNAGLAVATGDWVTFWDPDDMLTPPYAAEMRDFLDSPQAADVHLIVGRLVWFDDETGKRSRHPLDHRFDAGDRVVDLESQPGLIHLAANTGLYRRAVLAEHDITFDARVIPTFEDGHLTGRYLAKFDRPQIAFRGSAKYLYRRRSDNSSLVQSGWAKETKYLNQPKYGWLDMLRSTAADRGHAPRWAQYVVLYEMQWYFRSERQVPSRTAWIPAEVAADFHRTLVDVVELLDAECIENFTYSAAGIAVDMVAALLIGVKGQNLRPRHVTVDHIDVGRRLARLRYYFGGNPPEEVFLADGHPVRPVHTKTRRIEFLGKLLAHERIVWFSATDTLSLSLDGVPVPIEIGPVEGLRYEAVPERIWQELAEQSPPADPLSATPQGFAHRRRQVETALREAKRRLPRGRAMAKRMVADRAVRGLSSTPPARLAFGHAWLLMDKDTHAGDNAEHLYRYLRTEHPAINSWFVLNRNSSDWDRLAAEGFRLIEHGGPRHKIALLNATHLISSHVDHYVVAPLNRKRYGPPRWRYTFLQHGVIKDDLSTWLNPKPIDLMLTSTRDEFDSIAGSGTRYRYSSLEIALTGLPRHDRLWRLGQGATPAQRRTLLFMPTWRMTLLGERIGNSNVRATIDGFWETNFAQAWRALLESDRLRKAADANGYRLAFVPHPNMQEYLAEHPLPEHVSVMRFTDCDIQEVIAQGALLVTDYSSLAFEAAYLNRPVVYYQFDAEEFFSGSHVYTRGSWSYPENGFGPVCPDTDSALDAIVALLERDCEPDPVYAGRMNDTFEFRDGNCCRRAFQRIKAMETPPARSELYW